MKPFLIFFFLILIPGASANTLTFVDYGLSSQDIDIYYSNGTLLDTKTSNSSITLNSAFDYQIVFRPQKISILTDPSILLDIAVDYMPVLLTVLIVVSLYMVLSGRWKFG